MVGKLEDYIRGPISDSMDGTTDEKTISNALQAIGISDSIRMDVPMRDRHALPLFANALRDLADRFDALGRDSSNFNEYEALRQGARAVQRTHREMVDISKTPAYWAGR